ncbi:methionine--tRNA ligase [Candidatus Woesearchaeota archaeon]|nr:methionine--tRNA ligase [Candidatus Woesearchaeota archaeon]
MIVTSALPYANGPLHLGHLVEYIQTDIFVRFLRLTEKDVVYCCADDTHGTPIELKANELKIKPEQLIARVFKEHTRDFKNFLIKFDSYHTTNSKENKHFSDLIFSRLNEKGHIYTKDIEVTYCEHDKRTLPDRYVKGKCPKCGAEDQYGDVCEKCNAAYKTVDLIDPYCILCKKAPVKRTSKHYFFRLSSFSKFLEGWIKDNKNLQPEIKNFVLNWIKTGLEDWDISRDGPYFGFNIPGEKDKYYYVWLDAPIGYIASFANLVGNVEKAEKEWNNSEIIHFIGKDITYFHLLFWPAMLHGAGFKLPKDIVVHGFLTVNGEKMSKSRGTFFTAEEFLEKYDAEHLRYYYGNVLSKKLADIDLNFSEFRERINNELVGNLGNFCYRIISFVNKNFNGKIKNIDSNKDIIGAINQKVGIIKKHYEEFNFNFAVNEALLLSDIGNKYFQQNEPWKLIKEDKEKTREICALCVNIAKDLSILIQPVLPKFSEELQKQLNVKNLKWKDINFDLKNHKIGKEKILVEKIAEEKKEVFPLNLKVAKILDVKDHPDADKLYVLQIDLGREKRQLVAGLNGHYSKEELKNKRIIVITNLKYAKLRGIESQGMLLAGDDGKEVGVLTIKNAEPGAQVGIDNFENSNEQVTFEQFQKLKIVVKNNHPYFNGKEIKAGSEGIKVEKVKDGAEIR